MQVLQGSSERLLTRATPAGIQPAVQYDAGGACARDKEELRDMLEVHRAVQEEA